MIHYVTVFFHDEMEPEVYGPYPSIDDADIDVARVYVDRPELATYNYVVTPAQQPMMYRS
jgi:hypothetical protein